MVTRMLVRLGYTATSLVNTLDLINPDFRKGEGIVKFNLQQSGYKSVELCRFIPVPPVVARLRYRLVFFLPAGTSQRDKHSGLLA